MCDLTAHDFHASRLPGIYGQSLLSDVEREALLAAIPDGNIRVLEIGTKDGATAAYIAKARPRADIVSIDTFSGNAAENWQRNKQRNMTLFVGDIVAFAAEPRRPYNVVLIDASHHYGSCCVDLAHARRLITPGGLIVAHDYGRERLPKPFRRDHLAGVTRAVDEFCAGQRWHIDRQVVSLAFLRRDDEPKAA